MKKTLIFRAAIISMALFAFTACEKKTYEELFSITYTENSVAMQNDLHAFITEFCTNYNQTKFNVAMEKKTAQNLFNTFCIDLKIQADGQGFKVFENTWATFQLQNVLREKIDEKKVEFAKTSEAKRYLSITFSEIAPNGNTDAATTFIESKLAPFSLTKDTTTIDADGNVTNIYSFYKEYASAEEMQTDYNTQKATLNNIINILDNEWPANVLYTGELDLVCIFKDEGGEYFNTITGNLICHKPVIIGKNITWVTPHTPEVPFDTIQFSIYDNAPIPFFRSYKAVTKLNEVTSTDYAYRKGIAILVMDAQSGKSKYGFKVLDTERMQLIQKNGVDIVDGPIYTKVAQ